MSMTTMMRVEDLDTVFADVTPIPQDDGPNPVCVIAYKEDFTQAYDYMRAILKADERSGTSLSDTADTACCCLRLPRLTLRVFESLF